MMIYCFDKTTKEFAYTDVIDDGTPVPENATTIAPVNADGTGMYAPSWNGTNWVPMSEEEFQEKYGQQQRPDNVPEISESQKQEAQYMLEITRMKANIAANTKAIAMLTKQLTQMTLKTKEEQ